MKGVCVQIVGSPMLDNLSLKSCSLGIARAPGFHRLADLQRPAAGLPDAPAHGCGSLEHSCSRVERVSSSALLTGSFTMEVWSAPGRKCSENAPCLLQATLPSRT